MDLTDNPNYYTTARPYKPKLICCDCRKVFKRRLTLDFETKGTDSETELICPNCGKTANYVGPKFRAPKLDNVKAWKSLEVLRTLGTLHFMGFAHDKITIPESKKGLDDLLTNMKLSCEYSIRKWLSAEFDEGNKEKIKYFSDIVKKIDQRLKKNRL
jgi:hypothetical protein